MITGIPGSGKSRLAHALIEYGNQLVADDLVEVSQQIDGTLLGQAPKKLAGLLHLRHLGLFDIPELFGSDAYRKQANIDFAITLDPTLEEPPAILKLPLSTFEIYQQKIPAVNVNITNEKHPAAIVNLLVRQFFPQFKVPQSAKRNIISTVNS